jgi:hypothetical protein
VLRHEAQQACEKPSKNGGQKIADEFNISKSVYGWKL